MERITVISYSLVWLSLLFLSIYSGGRTKDAVYIFCLLFLVGFAGLRWEVGCDWSNYLRHYNIASDPSFSAFESSREIGWWYLLEVIHFFSLPYFSLNLIVAAFFFIAIHFTARRQNNPVIFLSVLFPMLILGIVMAAIRQAISIGFISLALLSFSDRKPIRMAFFVVLGSLFHTSALIFSPLIPLAFGQISRQRIILSALLAMPILVLVAASEGADRASNAYVGTEMVAKGVLIRLGSLTFSAAIFVIFLKDSWREHSKHDYGIAILFCICVFALLLVSGPASVIADRISYYFVPIQAVIVTKIFSLPEIRHRKALGFAQWSILTVALFAWMTLSSHFAGCYAPYQSIIFAAQ